MLENIIRRFRRAPLQALALILLSAVLSAALCGLVKLGQVQQEKYEQMYDSIPVKLRVTNLSATRRDDLECPRWVLDVFTGFGFGKNEPSLKEYVKEVHAKMSIPAQAAVLEGQSLEGINDIVGITGTLISEELENSKAGIKWVQGYEEDFFTTDDLECIISGSLVPKNWDRKTPLTIELTINYNDGWMTNKTVTKTLLVVGTHSVSSGLVYTSFETMRDLFSAVGKEMSIDAVTAVLADNSRQEEIRQAAYIRFAEPNATGEHTGWRWGKYFWYPYALEIDDSLLRSAEMSLKTSLLLGEVCSYILFILSAGAGFFVGFLMIRSRKREIALMRSMGAGGGAIFAGLAAEQILCVLVGTLLGGAAFLWQPLQRLEMFLAIYVLGLSAALLVFLNRNLMQALKEDE